MTEPMTPPMTLEETKEALQALRNRGTPHMQATVESALHHLEAGKWYTAEDMLFAAMFGVDYLTQNFPEIKLSPQPQQEVQG